MSDDVKQHGSLLGRCVESGIVARLLRERGVLTNEWPGPTDLDKEAAATIASLIASVDLLESNARVQARLLADTGRERDALRSALDQLHAFVAVMVGRGHELTIPKTVQTPLGIPVKVGQIMRDASAALALSRHDGNAVPQRAE